MWEKVPKNLRGGPTLYTNHTTFISTEQIGQRSRLLTLGGERSLGEATVVSHAGPVVEHVGDPVPQSEDRHWGEVKPGQDVLLTTVRSREDMSETIHADNQTLMLK